MKLNNKYYLLRHGEAKSNVENVVSCWPEKFHNPLTKDGVEKIENAAKGLKNKNIDLIFCSPLLRAKETAGIVAKELNFKTKIKFDKRLRELGFGTFNGKSAEEFAGYFDGGLESRIKNKTPRGENYTEVEKRVFQFFKEINKKYRGKSILIVSHQAPLLFLRAKLEDGSAFESVEKLHKIFAKKRFVEGELVELN